MVAPDDHTSGDGWAELQPEIWSAAAGTEYWYTATVRNSVPETSSESAVESFVMAAAHLDADRWRLAQ